MGQKIAFAVVLSATAAICIGASIVLHVINRPNIPDLDSKSQTP